MHSAETQTTRNNIVPTYKNSTTQKPCGLAAKRRELFSLDTVLRAYRVAYKKHSSRSSHAIHRQEGRWPRWWWIGENDCIWCCTFAPLVICRFCCWSCFQTVSQYPGIGCEFHRHETSWNYSPYNIAILLLPPRRGRRDQHIDVHGQGEATRGGKRFGLWLVCSRQPPKRREGLVVAATKQKKPIGNLKPHSKISLKQGYVLHTKYPRAQRLPQNRVSLCRLLAHSRFIFSRFDGCGISCFFNILRWVIAWHLI